MGFLSLRHRAYAITMHLTYSNLKSLSAEQENLVYVDGLLELTDVKDLVAFKQTPKDLVIR